MAPGATGVVTNGRVVMLHDPGSGFQDTFQAGDVALLDVHARASQGADQVLLLLLPPSVQFGTQRVFRELLLKCMCSFVPESWSGLAPSFRPPTLVVCPQDSCLKGARMCPFCCTLQNCCT